MKEFLSKFFAKREIFYMTSFFVAIRRLFVVTTFKGFTAYIMVAVEMMMALFFGYPVHPQGLSLDMSKFELVWADEFDGTELDRTKWRGHFFDLDSETPAMRRGGYWVDDMIEVTDGNLTIHTKYLEDGVNNGKAGYYSSGIETIYEQKFGYFETRCILPPGEDIWSAFWMYCAGVGEIGNGGRDGAEIDIFEAPFYADKKNNCVYMNVHYDGYGEHHKSENLGKFYVPDPYTTYNTYGLEWNEDEYIFYINGIEAARTDFGGTSLVPEPMLLTVEVGGTHENGVLYPSEEVVNSKINKEVLPSKFIVDYVRSYQYKDGIAH